MRYYWSALRGHILQRMAPISVFRGAGLFNNRKGTQVAFLDSVGGQMQVTGIFKLNQTRSIELDDPDVSNEEVLRWYHRQNVIQLALLGFTSVSIILCMQTVPLGGLTDQGRTLVVAGAAEYCLILLFLKIKQRTELSIQRVRWTNPAFTEIGIERNPVMGLEHGPLFGGDHFRLNFRLWTGIPFWCWVEAIQGPEITAVIFTEAPSNAGGGMITNHIEELATWAREKYDLVPRKLVVIKHYPAGWGLPSDREEWGLVEFEWARGRAHSPEWAALPADTFGQILELAGAEL